MPNTGGLTVGLAKGDRGAGWRDPKSRPGGVSGKRGPEVGTSGDSVLPPKRFMVEEAKLRTKAVRALAAAAVAAQAEGDGVVAETRDADARRPVRPRQRLEGDGS